MDPKEFGNHIFNRALEADDAEWQVMVEQFKSLSFYDRVVCWTAATKHGIKHRDQIERLFKHFAKYVLECFDPRVNPECKAMLERLDRESKESATSHE